MKFDFKIERDLNQEPYEETLWNGDKKEVRIAPILAFYKVVLYANPIRTFNFEVRESNEQLEIDNDDEIRDFLYLFTDIGSKKKRKSARKEVNDFYELISTQIMEDFIKERD